MLLEGTVIFLPTLENPLDWNEQLGPTPQPLPVKGIDSHVAYNISFVVVYSSSSGGDVVVIVLV